MCLQLFSVTRKFGEFTALDSVSAGFDPEKIYILAGPNGAGKTTLLRIIAGLLRPTSGKIVFHTAARVGVMFQESYLYLDLSPGENLELYAGLCGVSRERIDYVRSLLELDDFFNHDVGTLSHGQRRRVSLARSLLPDPKILLLDEPFLGLDASSTAHVQRFLADFRRGGGTALIATHELELIRETADDLMLLDKGWVKYFGKFNV